MNVPTCPSWCTDHLIEEDTDGSATDIHRGTVTRGEVTLTIETSPQWSSNDLPILVDEFMTVDAAGARDLAAALLAAARLLEADPGR